MKYNIVRESFGGAIIGATGGGLLGVGIGAIIDYARSSGARAEADKAKAKWLIDHKNDYSNKDIIVYLEDTIERNIRRVKELEVKLQTLLTELKLANSDKKEEWSSRDREDARRKEYRLRIAIQEVHDAIRQCNDTISECRIFLKKKMYSVVRSRLVARDADNERERVYNSLKKSSGKVIGGLSGAAIGGILGGKYL